VKPLNVCKGIEYNSPEKAQTALDILNRPFIQFLCNTALRESVPTWNDRLKLPSFIRFFPKYQNKYQKETPKITPEPLIYQYTKKPPSLSDIILSTEENTKVPKIGLPGNNRITTDIYSMISPFKGITQKEKLQELDKILRFSCEVKIFILYKIGVRA